MSKQHHNIHVYTKMETYKEYPIRCKTCNEQLACYADDYETLLATGLSVEEALNELGITDYCSRISMMTPTIVAFNMENREVIEGFKSVDAANEIDAQNESTARPVFNPCMGLQANLPQVGVTKPVLTNPLITATQPVQTRVQPNVPGIQPTQGITLTQIPPRIQPGVPLLNQPGIPTLAQPGIPTLAQPGIPLLNQPGIPTLGQIPQRTGIPTIAPTVRTNVPTLGLVAAARPLQTQPFLPQQIVPPIQPLGQTPPGQAPLLESPTIVPPILPPEFSPDIETLGVGIPVKDIENVVPPKFKDPVVVGVPTINPDTTNPLPTVYVGAGKYVQVLNGRTYLAQ